jgi:hypothetical protein
MKKIFSLLLVAVICSQGLNAQSSFTISYPIGFPMGNLSDYIGAVSYRGISMEFNKRVKPNLDVGIESGWNVFYEKQADKVYTDGTSSISGVQFRYTNTVPIILGVKFHKDIKDKGLSPFGGLGLGTLYVDRSTDFGLYRITNDAWQFCIRPELGLMIHAESGVGFLIGVKYYAAFNTDDLDAQSYLTANIGVVFSNF